MKLRVIHRRALVAIALLGSACTQQAASPLAPVAVTNLSPSFTGEVLVGAGDIGDCRGLGPELTAELLDEISGTVFAAGDNAYEDGTLDEYQRCYEPTWGRHKARTRPAPGNHEYNTPGASGYFTYFGSNAGPAGLGYYSYDLGQWHVLSLNSSIQAGVGSAQYQWVRADLQASQAKCTIAYWHYPVFNSGYDGNLPHMRAIFALLYEFHAELVVAAHAHSYERFAPQDPDGRVDREHGIREFVIGTGGAPFTGLVALQPNSDVFNATTLGVLKLTLDANGYGWQFVSDGSPFTDSGSGSCS